MSPCDLRGAETSREERTGRTGAGPVFSAADVDRGGSAELVPGAVELTFTYLAMVLASSPACRASSAPGETHPDR